VLAYRAVPPGGGDVEARMGGRGNARLDRWAVVRCQLLISLFEFKFDRLNMNLTI
jgi:hypothetical protein